MLSVNTQAFALGFYTCLCQDISHYKYSESESQMPYQLSRLYLSSREHLKTFFLQYLRLLFFGQIVGAASFFVY